MRYLTKKIAVQLNKATVDAHSGNFSITFEQKRHF
jgi:hypothetical protein